MLDFIWHLRGIVPLKGVGSDEEVLDRVSHLLAKQEKGLSERGSDYLVFDNPLWLNVFGSRWAALVIYDRGRFWLENGVNGRRLRYDLRSLHGMVFCLILAAAACLVGLAGYGLNEGLEVGAKAFAWLYGANILLALFRVPYAIRRAANDA